MCHFPLRPLAAAALLMLTSSCVPPFLHAAKPNVLFIAVDDLRPQLGCYGEDYMVTPNMDRLAASSRVFNRHYVQVATCGASRYALLTGLRPKEEVHYSNRPFLDRQADLAEHTTESFPHLFKQNGYRTIAIGKISHNNITSLDDLPRSWSSVRELEHLWGAKHNFVNAYAQIERPAGHPIPRNKGYAFESVPLGDKAYPDAWIAEHAMQTFEEIKDEPFFLAVGFMKPHLPFNAPETYWDLYDPDTIPAAPYPNIPDNIIPGMALNSAFELLGQYDVPEGGLDDPEYIKKLRHGYCAATSYVDAQIGKVLDELNRLGLSENTIVVLWGDHGWHLGDLGSWGKHTAFEYALRSPLLVRVPGIKQPGVKTDALIETVDIYPTLAALCELPLPEDVEGNSFAEQLDAPFAKGPEEAFGYHRPWAYKNNPYESGPWAKTIRTDRYRFTRWTTGIESGKIVDLELYDYQTDPGGQHNVADQFPKIVASLSARLDNDGHKYSPTQTN